MPVIELRYDRLQRLVGGLAGRGRASKKAIDDALPYLGLDIEGRGAGTVRVEYSPNRPDYSTDWGIAAGLRGLLLPPPPLQPGAAEGGPKVPHVGPGRAGMRIRADPSVAAVRPVVTAVAAHGCRLDGHSLAQLITMQEDLHDGIGRGRRKASIGLHDAAAVRFPLSYVTAGRGHRFVPLGHTSEATAGEVLSGTKIGAEYGRLLGGSPRIPLVLDAAGATLSMPPVINGARTALTESTTGVVVEVTGTDRAACEDALSVAAVTLHRAGFALERVRVSGAGNRTPRLGPRAMSVDAGLISESLGIEMPAAEAAESLRRAGIGASVRGARVSCSVPRHRFDILGPMDLVEEALLGYGVRRIKPELPPSPTIGSLHPGTALARSVRLAMVGLGYTEALSPSLSGGGGGGALRAAAAGESGREAAVLDSKSSDHTMLRSSLLPGLLAALSGNVHEPYPQRLFEIGAAFESGAARGSGGARPGAAGARGPPSESVRLCAVSAHSSASYTEVRGVLEAVAAAALGGPCSARTMPAGGRGAPFADGRAASVHAAGRRIGAAGEVDAGIVKGLRIRQPVAAFEVELPINTAAEGKGRPKSRRADGPR